MITKTNALRLQTVDSGSTLYLSAGKNKVHTLSYLPNRYSTHTLSPSSNTNTTHKNDVRLQTAYNITRHISRWQKQRYTLSFNKKGTVHTHTIPSLKQRRHTPSPLANGGQQQYATRRISLLPKTRYTPSSPPKQVTLHTHAPSKHYTQTISACKRRTTINHTLHISSLQKQGTHSNNLHVSILQSQGTHTPTISTSKQRTHTRSTCILQWTAILIPVVYYISLRPQNIYDNTHKSRSEKECTTSLQNASYFSAPAQVP